MSSSRVARALGKHFNLNDDENLDVPVEETPIGEGVDGAAVETSEATELVEAENNDIEQLVEDHENLEKVAGALEESVADGQAGISEEAAKWARLAVDNIIGKYGLTDEAMPSMENFGGASTRTRATVLTLESVRTIIAEFWKTIWAKIQKLWAYIKNWWLKVVDAAPRLKKSAEALIVRARGLTGVAKEGPIKAGLSGLLVGGAAPDMGKEMGRLVTLSAEMMRGNEAQGKTIERLIARVESGAKGEEDAKAAMESYKAFVEKLPHDASSRFGANVLAKMSDELPGGKAVVAKVPKDYNAKLSQLATEYGANLTTFAEKASEGGKDVEFKVLSSTEIQAVASDVIKLCDAIIDYKKLWSERDALAKKLNDAVKKAEADADKGTGEGASKDGAVIKDVAQAAAIIWKNEMARASEFINYLIKTGRDALSYGEKSAAQYGKK